MDANSIFICVSWVATAATVWFFAYYIGYDAGDEFNTDKLLRQYREGLTDGRKESMILISRARMEGRKEMAEAIRFELDTRYADMAEKLNDLEELDDAGFDAMDEDE